MTVERTELLTDGGVSPFGDGEEGADEDNFNFLFEGGISLPWSVRGTGSPSNARYTRCIAYNKITSQHSAMNFLKITTVFSQVPKLPPFTLSQWQNQWQKQKKSEWLSKEIEFEPEFDLSLG